MKNKQILFIYIIVQQILPAQFVLSNFIEKIANIKKKKKSNNP